MWLLAVLSILAGMVWGQVEGEGLLRDEVYGRKFGMALTMDVAFPQYEPNGAAVIVIVSGGWYSWWESEYDKPYEADLYLANGYTVFWVRHGGAPRFSIEEGLEDVRRAVRFIRMQASRYGIDPARIGVTGNSAGGHLALMLGLTGDEGTAEAKRPIDRVSCHVAAVAALVPPTDLSDMAWSSPRVHKRYRKYPGLDISQKEAARLSPVKVASADDAPSLFYFAEDDEVVPPAHGDWLSEALERSGVPHRSFVFANAKHWPGEENFDRFQGDALAWFNEYLRAESKP
ncbi:alpha/beta hydrolase [Pelagicoccus enzymogenes]|nr:alpha/beta hydrolase [Pelagicoccus enzymogenes]